MNESLKTEIGIYPIVKFPRRLSRERCFVLMHEGLGDVIMHFPALVALSRFCDEVWVTNQHLNELKSMLPNEITHRMHVTDEYSRQSMLSGDIDELEKIHHGKFKNVLNLRIDGWKNNNRVKYSSEYLRLRGIRVFDLFEYSGPAPLGNIRAAVELLLKSLGVHDQCGLASLGWMESLLGSPKSHHNGREIGMFVGAGHSIKLPSIDIHAKIVAQIAKHSRTLRVVSGISPNERQLADEVVRVGRSQGLECQTSRPNSLAELIAELRRVWLLLAPDTSAIHIAEALGVPTIGYYLSTDGHVYGPKSAIRVQSPFLQLCPQRTNFGNCTAWGKGCNQLLTCHKELPIDEIGKQLARLMSADLGYRHTA